MSVQNVEKPMPKPRKRVPRHQVMQRLLAHFDSPRYLEVGVCSAETFDQVKASVRVAVDPEFLFDHTAAERQVPGTTYHQVTSDEYFGSIIEPDTQFDVIFLDGLHTFEQTLRDLINALPHLQPNGVIVIDDVKPPTALAAIRDQQEFYDARAAAGRENERQWMGDVFRLVFFIETFFQQLTYRVIANNHGQAVLWRNRRESVPDRLVSDIAALDFDGMVRDMDRMRLAPYGEILREIRADLGIRRRRDSED